MGDSIIVYALSNKNPSRQTLHDCQRLPVIAGPNRSPVDPRDFELPSRHASRRGCKSWLSRRWCVQGEKKGAQSNWAEGNANTEIRQKAKVRIDILDEGPSGFGPVSLGFPIEAFGNDKLTAMA